MLCLALLGGLCVPQVAAASPGAEVAPAATAAQKSKIKKFKKRKTTLKVAATTTSSVKLKWTKVAGAKKYIVYRATSKSGKYTKIASVAASKLSYTNKSLKANKKYYYKVRAFAKIGGQSVRSKSSDIRLGKTKSKAAKPPADKPEPIIGSVDVESINYHRAMNGVLRGASFTMWINVSNADACKESITLTETLTTDDYVYKYWSEEKLASYGCSLKRTAKFTVSSRMYKSIEVYAANPGGESTYNATTYTLSSGGKSFTVGLPLRVGSLSKGGSFPGW